MKTPVASRKLLSDAVALGKRMGLDKKAPDVAPVVDDSPAPVLGNGSKVRITHGDIPELRKDDATVLERGATGVVGRVEGAPYVSRGGPHKGELIQPIREEGTGMVLVVPASRLERSDRLGVSRVGYSRKYAENYDRIFGSKKKES